MGLILAGGKAERMGGVNKGAQTLFNKPLVEHVIDKLQPQVKTLFISANQYVEFYEKYGFSIIADERPDFSGPLAGLEAAMKNAIEYDWICCTPVDTPFIPSDLVIKLLSHATNKNANCAMVVHDQIKEPLLCLVHTKLLESLSNFLNEGHHSVGQWLQKENALEVDFKTDKSAFININFKYQLHSLNGAP